MNANLVFRIDCSLPLSSRVAEVEADQGVGGGGRPPCLRYGIEHPVSQLCFNIRYRVYNVLR